jgi:hypothetical protein
MRLSISNGEGTRFIRQIRGDISLKGGAKAITELTTHGIPITLQKVEFIDMAVANARDAKLFTGMKTNICNGRGRLRPGGDSVQSILGK